MWQRAVRSGNERRENAAVLYMRYEWYYKARRLGMGGEVWAWGTYLELVFIVGVAAQLTREGALDNALSPMTPLAAVRRPNRKAQALRQQLALCMQQRFC